VLISGDIVRSIRQGSIRPGEDPSVLPLKLDDPSLGCYGNRLGSIGGT
jgi:hypothetical protein